MVTKKFVHPYNNSLRKRLFNVLFSLFGLILLSPLFLLISILIKLDSRGPAFFIQKRVGKESQVFKFIKFRTMKKNAERQQRRYRHLNEADGPVFKIKDDPRFTRIGKLLARTGLDELPQLINVLKGEMSLVGPRPLPVAEAKKLTKAQKVRELIKPGITSSWVIGGTHSMKFSEWMQLDKQYVLKASLGNDVSVLLKTLLTVIKLVFQQIPLLLKK